MCVYVGPPLPPPLWGGGWFRVSSRLAPWSRVGWLASLESGHLSVLRLATALSHFEGTEQNKGVSFTRALAHSIIKCTY